MHMYNVCTSLLVATCTLELSFSFLQVHKCIADGKQGRSLPSDFKFTQQTGSKVQHGGIWAYPVGGVLQDLIPLTPDSHSIVDESGSHSNTDVDQEGTQTTMTADSSLFTSG